MENTKKGFLISAIAVFVLVVLIIGVSYAMFSFSSTGTKANVINTGSVTISYVDITTMDLKNQYPMSDLKGLGSSNVLEFSVDANIKGKINIDYELGLVNIVEGANNLKSNMVKIAMYEGDTQIIGTTTSGVLISDLKDSAGKYIDNYYLWKGTFSAPGGSDPFIKSVRYKIVAWISEDYKFATNDSTAESSDHSSETIQETYKFQVQVEAAQVA